MKTDNPAGTRRGSKNTVETGFFENSGPAAGPTLQDARLASVIEAWGHLSEDSRLRILQEILCD